MGFCFPFDVPMPMSPYLHTVSLSLHVSMPQCLHVSMSPRSHVSMSPHLHVSPPLCLRVSMSPCLHVSMSPCLLVSMSPCIHVSMSSCLHVSMFPCLYVSMSLCLHVSMSMSMSPRFRNTANGTELTENGHFRLFYANGKRKQKTETETENGRLCSLVGKQSMVIDVCCLSKHVPNAHLCKKTTGC
jgi:hypothetical protein